MKNYFKTHFFKKTSHVITTRSALIWMYLANEPLVALYTLLLFILRKDLHANAFQISLFATLRPVMSVLSFYWSSNLLRQREKLLSNLMGAWVLARIPFLCLPFINNVWYLIFSAGVYQLFSRAAIPSMIEILKLNMQKEPREKLFSQLYIISFIESIILGIVFGRLLDMYEGTWIPLFFVASILSLTSILIQMRIPLPLLKQDTNIPPITTNRLLQPIKDSIHLMRLRPDFSRFQWGFMIGGFGLMFITPAVTIYYADILNLTHNHLAIARYIWMGIGVVISTFLWKYGLNTFSLNRVTASIILGFSFFPITLLLAKQNLIWINIAFFIYGIAQAGSHLTWNLSGTFFSKNEDSSKFSRVNILMVGVRGMIAPVLGGFFCNFFTPPFILIIGMIICFFGAILMLHNPVKITSPLPSSNSISSS